MNAVVMSQRRITNGTLTDRSIKSDFMVYFLNANTSEYYGDWICSGTIIHPYLVLTSAACLIDVKLLYVIAGYEKYVPTHLLETDTCTQRFKKKVISICTTSKYELDRNLGWVAYDIGIAKTDSQFDFYDLDYKKYCSYTPNQISVQYNRIFESAGTNVLTFGWGHSSFYSPPNDDRDMNERILQYASTVIMDKEDCKAVHDHPSKKEYIDSVMICTSGAAGHIDGNGEYQNFEPPKHASCARRSGASGSNETDLNCRHEKIEVNSSSTPLVNSTRTYNVTRRHGPCQNDHGSPLIGWVGGERYVLGIAAAPNVLPSMQCTGPYLWTSVTATSKFVNCVLSAQITSFVDKKTRRMCGEEKIIEIDSTWPESTLKSDEIMEVADETLEVADTRKEPEEIYDSDET